MMSMASLDIFLLLLISELLCNRSSLYLQTLHMGSVLGDRGILGGYRTLAADGRRVRWSSSTGGSLGSAPEMVSSLDSVWSG